MRQTMRTMTEITVLLLVPSQCKGKCIDGTKPTIYGSNAQNIKISITSCTLYFLKNIFYIKIEIKIRDDF